MDVVKQMKCVEQKIIHGLKECVGKVLKSTNECDLIIYSIIIIDRYIYLDANKYAMLQQQHFIVHCILKSTIQGKQGSKRYIPLSVRWTMLQNAIHLENSQGTF